MKYYGHLVFKPCVVDYPKPDTKVTITAGDKELFFRVKEDEKEKEGIFRITRIRCWRISVVVSLMSSFLFKALSLDDRFGLNKTL